MKRLLIIALLISAAVLSACSGADEPLPEQSKTPKQEAENTEDRAKKNAEIKSLTMAINSEEVKVTWEDNDSVRALAELAKDSPLTIDSSNYDDFEQVGDIGTTLPSNDVDTVTKPGDIVLYSGNNIVVFYGSNSWPYTMLGHIEGKSENELKDLLGSGNVTITITTE